MPFLNFFFFYMINELFMTRTDLPDGHNIFSSTLFLSGSPLADSLMSPA